MSSNTVDETVPTPPPPPSGGSLDPIDWGEFRAFAHRVIDEMVSYQRDVRKRPVWQPVPAVVQEGLRQSPPWGPSDPDVVFSEFKRFVLPYPVGNIHPRFWGWVNGAGTPFAMLAELMAAAMNTNAAGFDQSSTIVEEQVLAWLDEILGLGWHGEGLLVSGGSMANLLGLAVARNVRAGFDVRAQGLSGSEVDLAVYGATESHSSVQRALQLLGLGDRSWRAIPVDDDYRLDVGALRAALARDKGAGGRPVCVVATAGTTSTGAIDDLDAIADVCEREDVWLHVDGAFGALAAISTRLRGRVAGLPRANSLAIDLHKWLQMPYGAGCVLVRGGDDLTRSFSTEPPYLARLDGGISANGVSFMNRGIELSRSFSALKVWMSFKVHGVDAFRRLVERNVQQAQLLAERVRSESELELMAPVPLNIVCFRYRWPGATEPELTRLNKELLVQIQESGDFVPSGTSLHGRFSLRVAITNHRTLDSDLEELVTDVLVRGRGLCSRTGSESDGDVL